MAAAVARLAEAGITAEWLGTVLLGGKTLVAIPLYGEGAAVWTDGFSLILDEDEARGWAVRWARDIAIEEFDSLEAGVDFVIERYRRPWPR